VIYWGHERATAAHGGIPMTTAARPAPRRALRTTTAGLAAAVLLAVSACTAAPDGATAPDTEPDTGSATEPTSEPAPASPVSPTETTTTTGPGGPASGGAAVAAPGEPGVLATGLDAPWSVAFHGQVPLVSERDSARILELAADGGTREVGTVPDVSHGGEGGLLGLAVHEGWVYAYSTGPDGNRIQRFEVTGEPGSLGLGAPQEVFGGIPKARNHNGGRIAFGPDGMLYATTGDAGDRGAAQDVQSLAGKILRLAPDGGIPADNPIEGSPVYSFGHRNPQGLAWGPDGTMYASEFGQNTWDELNIIEAGSNYGWPEVEGIGGDAAAGRGFTDPVQQWPTDEASPSGIAVVGKALYIANLRGEWLRQVPLDDLATATEHWRGEYGRLRDAVAAPDGRLWVLTNTTDGRGRPGPDDDRILAVDVD
jgi:glucose/arabinose dehydrogenase